ncbi:MAG: hypothetical protein K2P67_11305 [Gallionellaceae bacterium]|nr:hypothetical protein [Gallionellaceae bacterium]
MKFMQTSKIFVLALISSLAGCAHYEWYSKTKNQSSFDGDRYKCIQQAAQTYPAIMQQVTYGTPIQTPTQTTCVTTGDHVTCTTTPGQYTPPPPSVVDLNEGNRTQAYNACMTASGWELREVVK